MSAETANPVGRPRSFDKEQALDAAMHVFWTYGYEGASLTALTEAMGINRPSLYATFGDKKSLFSKILDRYTEGPISYVVNALAQPTARAFAEDLLMGAADSATGADTPHSCLFLQSVSTPDPEADSIQQEVIRRRNIGNKLILQRLTRAKREGDLPADCNPADLGRLIISVMRGLAVLAADGASRAELHRVVHTALSVWPK